MSVIYMLITISIAVAIVFFVLFVLAVRKGQYDDSYTPSVRMLFDDELIKNPEEIKKETTEESNTNTNQQS
ncbi:cbb3-type cytochrome oxidase assembly protein CcoS [Imtechella halotolerans]|nr:cbb3-type cytochrome oxidase assembly protein CcoS [Imtechella halotolerans]WMQ62376.1 cbb3-type cytochrome oxidase assembly protein CcoS [Imtechella halotolerans]